MSHKVPDTRNQAGAEEYDETIYETIYESIYETYLEDDLPSKTDPTPETQGTLHNGAGKSLAFKSDRSLASLEAMIVSTDPTTKAMGLDALRDSNDHDTRTKLSHAFQCLDDTNMIINDAAIQLLRVTVEDDPLPLLQDAYETATEEFHDAVVHITSDIIFRSQKMTDASISILSMLSQVHLDLALFILTQMMNGFRQKNIKNVELTSNALKKLEPYIDRAIDTSALVEFPGTLIKSIADSLTVALKTKGLGIKEVAEDYISNLTHIIPADLLLAEFTKNKLVSVKGLTSTGNTPGPITRPATKPPLRSQSQPKHTQPSSHRGSLDVHESDHLPLGNADLVVSNGATGQEYNMEGLGGSQQSLGDQVAGGSRHSFTDRDDSLTHPSDSLSRVDELKYVYTPPNFDPDTEDWISMMYIPRSILSGITDSSWQVRKEVLELVELLFNPFLAHPQPSLTIAQCENRKNNKTIAEEILMRINEIIIGDQNIAVVIAALGALRIMLIYLPSSYYNSHSKREITESILQKLKSRKPSLLVPCYNAIDVILGRFLTLEEFIELPILQNALPEVPRDVIDKVPASCSFKTFTDNLEEYIKNDKRPIPPSKSALNTYLYIEFCRLLQRQMTFILFLLLSGVYKKNVLQDVVPSSIIELLHAYTTAPNIVIKLDLSESFQAMLAGMGAPAPLKTKEIGSPSFTLSLKMESVAGLSSLRYYPLSFVGHLCRGFLCETSLHTLSFIKICTGTLMRDMSSEVRSVSKEFDSILNVFMSLHRSVIKQKAGASSRGSSPARKAGPRAPNATKGQPQGQGQSLPNPAQIAINPTDSSLLDLDPKKTIVHASLDGSDSAPGKALVNTSNASNASQRSDPSSSPEKPKTPQPRGGKTGARSGTPGKVKTPVRTTQNQPPQIIGTAGKTKFIYYHAYDFPAEVFRTCSFDSGTNFKRVKIMLRPPSFLLYKIGPVCTADDLAFVETLSTPKYDFSLIFQPAHSQEPRDGTFYILADGEKVYSHIEPLVDQFSLIITKTFMANSQKKPVDKSQNLVATVVSIFRILGMLIMACNNETILIKILPVAGIILNTIYSKDLGLYNTTVSAYIYHVLTFIPYRLTSTPAKVVTAWKKLLTVAFDIHGLVPVYYTLFAIMAAICKELENEDGELNVRNGQYILTLGEYLHEIVKFLHDKFDPVHSAAGFSLRITSELLIHILELGAYLYGGCAALTGPSGLLIRVNSKLLAMLVYFLRNVNGLEQMDPVFLSKVLDCEVIPTLKGLYSSGAFEAACMYSAINCLRTIRDADSELAKYIQAVLACCNKTDFPRLTLSTRAPKTCMQLDVEADRGKIHNCDFRKPTNLYNVIRDLSTKNPGIYDALAMQGLVSIQKYAVTSDKSPHQPVKPMSEHRESREQRSLAGGDTSHNASSSLHDGSIQDGRKQRYSADECVSVERMSLDGDRSVREKTNSSRPPSARSRRSISHRDGSSLYDEDQDTSQPSKHDKDKTGKSDMRARQRTVSHHTVESAIKAHRSLESPDSSLQQEDASSIVMSTDRTSLTEGDGRERSVLKKATSTPLRKIASSMRNKSSTILQMKLSNVPEFLQPYYRAPGFEIPLTKILGVLSEYECALSAEKDSMVRSDLTVAMIQALSLYEEHSIDSTKISRKLLQSIDEKVHTESNANAGDYYLLLMTELARTGTVVSVFEQAWSIGLINMLGMTRRPITRSYAVQALNMCMNSHVILTATAVTKSYMGGSILKALNGTSASYSITSPTAGIIATIKQEALNWILSDMLPSIISFVSESEVFYTFENSAVLHQIWTQCEELAANSKSTAMRGTANEILHMLQQVQAACKEQDPKKPARVSKPNREEILGKELAQTINELEKTTRYNSKNTDDAIKRALSAERNRLSQPQRNSVDANASSICSEEGFSTTAIYLGGLSAVHASAPDGHQDTSQRTASSHPTMSKPAIPRHSNSSRQSFDDEGFGSAQRLAKNGPARKESTDSYMVDDLNEPSFRSVANSSLLERHSEPLESRNISHSSRSSLSQNHPNESLNALSTHMDSTITKSSLAIILHNVHIPFSGRHENRFAAACKLICDSSSIISLLTPYIFERQASISATDIRVVRHIINESMLNADITAPMIDLNGVDPNSLIPIRSVHFNEEDVHNGVLAILKQYKMEMGTSAKYSKESVQAFSSVSLLYSALALSNDFVTEGWRPLASTITTVCKCIGTLCKYIKDLRDFKILVGPLLVRLTAQPSYQEKLAIQRALDLLLERHQAIEEEYLKTPGKRIIRHFLQNYLEIFDDSGANIHLKYVALKVITEYLEMIIEGIDDFKKVQPILEPWLPSVTTFFKRLCITTFKKSCKVSDELAGKAFIDYVKTEFKDPAITVEYINNILSTKESFLLALCNLSGSKTVNSFAHYYRNFMDKLSSVDAGLMSTWVESILDGRTLRVDIKEATMVADMFSPGTNEYVEYDIISINESLVDDAPVSHDAQGTGSKRTLQSQQTPTLTNSTTHSKDSALSNDPLMDVYSTSPRKGQRTDMDALIRDAEQVLGQSLRQSLSARAVAESMHVQPKQHDAIEGDNDMVELFTRMGTLVTDVDVDLLDDKVAEELRSSKLYKNRNQQKDRTRDMMAEAPSVANQHDSAASTVPPMPAALSSYTVPSLSLDEVSSFNADADKVPGSVKQQDGRAANLVVSTIADSAEKASANPSPSKELSVVRPREFPSTDRFASLAKSTEGLPLAVAGVVDQIDYKFKTLDTIERLQSAARLSDSSLTEAMSFTLKSLTDSMTGTIIKTFDSENMRKLVDAMLYIKRQLTVSLQDDTTMMLFVTRIVSFLQNYLSNKSFRGLVQAREFHDLKDIPADLGKNKPSFYGEDIAFEAIKQVQRSISSLSGTGVDPVRISMLTLLIEDCLTLLTIIIDASSATHLIKALIQMFTVIYEEGLLVYRASEFPLLRPYYTTSHSIVQNILNSLLDKLTQIVAHAPQDFSQDITHYHAEFLAKQEVPKAASAFSGTLFSIFLILSGSLSMYPNVNNKQHSSYSLTSGHSSCPSELTFLYPRPCIITCIKRLTDDLDTAARDTLSSVCGLEIVSQLGSL